LFYSMVLSQFVSNYLQIVVVVMLLTCKVVLTNNFCVRGLVMSFFYPK
jgi:hypothetical protein